MLYLTEKDLLTLLDCEEMITGIERAYNLQVSGEYIMPDRMHLHYDDNTLLFMPCVIDTSYCTKLVTVFPNNKEKQLPVVDGIVVLNDKETGKINALIDGRTLTAIRTGAVGGTAIKYCSNEDVKVLGIIGCGVQGFYQALFADYVRDFDKILLFDTYDYNPMFKEKFADKIEIVESADELVGLSDVVVTTTTSHEPIFKTNHVQGKTFIGIGSFKPEMREYSDEFICQMDTIIVDTPFASQESGDLKMPLDRGIINKNDIQIFRPKKIEGTVFFKSVGMALFDNVIAESLYLKAVKKNMGHVLEG